MQREAGDSWEELKVPKIRVRHWKVTWIFDSQSIDWHVEDQGGFGIRRAGFPEDTRRSGGPSLAK